MRSLRLFRSSAPAPGAKSAELDGNGGLLAFASETTPSAVAPAATATQVVTDTPAVRLARSRIVVPLLAVLVLLQAGPTFFWVRDRYFSAAPAATAAANVPPPAPFLAAGLCEPPVPDQPALMEASAAAAATTAAAPPRPPALVAGLLSVETPVPMRVYARGRLVGTTEAETIMLPVGTHELTLENSNVGYQTRRTVTVQAGRTSTVRLEPPAGSMNVNAVPWAEILVDGRRVGETPLAHVPVSIGSHEVVFRHPELGERRASVLVTLKGPARVSMDLRAK